MSAIYFAKSHQRKKLKQENAHKEKQVIDEDGWRVRVAAALTQANPSPAELATLPTVLSLLIYYLATAPSEDDALCLQSEIATLKIRIDRGYASPLRLVGKATPGG